MSSSNSVSTSYSDASSDDEEASSSMYGAGGGGVDLGVVSIVSRFCF